MTLAATFWFRHFSFTSESEDRYFSTEPGTRVLARCNWQPNAHHRPTLVLVHGLEGSSESGYMLGTAARALEAGFNVLRLNQRNCGGTEHLSPTLYNSGLTSDIHAVLRILIADYALPELFLAGFSMGGNIVLKTAGEMAADFPPQLRAVCAVAPSLDLAAGADACDLRRNCLYRWHFVRELKRRFRRKVMLFPQRYSLDGLDSVRTIRQFDDVVTAPAFGFRDSSDYYFRSSALRVAGRISLPALVIAAEDDTLVPFHPFRDPVLTSNPHVTLVTTQHGGHCGFISTFDGPERFWVEPRIVEFCSAHSRL
jgi:hypothetical protein